MKTEEEILLDRALEELRKVRNWVPSDYYRVNILPLIYDIKDKLSVVHISKDNYQDTVPTELQKLKTNFGIFRDI